MAEFDVTQADVLEAAQFLQAYLTEKITDGDFTEGSPNYDFVILGVSYAFAYLRKKQKQARNSQSLLTLRNLDDDASVIDAADAILANLFRRRAGGRFAKGVAVMHFSQRADFLLSRNTRFFKTASIVFYPDMPEDLFVSSNQLTAVRGSDGRVSEYTYSVNAIAAAIGTQYNQDVGRFVGVDRFSPFITFVENTTPLSDGSGLQTTAQFIDSSGTALSLRSLVNARSNDSTLKENFPGEVERVLTVGAGDPEMMRDVVTEVASGITLHVGGHVDIFLRMPIQAITEREVVGDRYVRPDNRKLILRDTSGTRDFVAGTGGGLLGRVLVGDTLFLSDGIPNAPFQFKIVAVRPDELEVSQRTPFSIATDETDVVEGLTISIGNNYPVFANKLATITSSDFVTSRTTIRSGRIGLTGRPIYKVKKVEILSAPSTFDAYKNPSTTSLIFTNRVNSPIVEAPTPGGDLPFRIVVTNPQESQSALAVTELEIGWPGADFDGLDVEVTYDTLSGFDSVDAFVRSPDERVAAGSVLPRGFHPVYLSFSIPYALTVVADPFQGNVIQPFDEDAVARSLTEFINAYRSPDALSQSVISTQAAFLARTMASTYPFVIEYELFAPDGRVYRYQTTDRISVFTDGAAGVTLLNPTEFDLPSTGYSVALRQQLTQLGISDRNLRYFVGAADVAFERRV